jgi:glucose-1-phosphate thymidylyltransferase
MKDLTKELPKPLLEVNSKSLLLRKMESLPQSITEIILIIGYKGEKIIERFGNSFNGIPITYIEDKTLTGTAHALWNAKELLCGRFLVMMGDDLYARKDLEACSKIDFSIVCKRAAQNEAGSRITKTTDGRLENFVTQEKYLQSHTDGGLIFTGLYSLTVDIFNYEPVKMKTKEEWGLPQTLLVVSNKHPVTIIETDDWISITDPEDLVRTEKTLLS